MHTWYKLFLKYLSLLSSEKQLKLSQACWLNSKLRNKNITCMLLKMYMWIFFVCGF